MFNDGPLLQWESTEMAYGEMHKMLVASLDMFRHGIPAVSGNRTQHHRWSLSVLCSHSMLIEKIRTGYLYPSLCWAETSFFFSLFCLGSS